MENELVVRLVECAKPLNSVYDSNDPTQVLVTGWADTTTVPKRGEICLEYYTNTDSSSENYGKICYRMKIGDGIHKYIESDPDDSLPYFPLSDDVINLIASWVNTHLNVNEYAQANYNNSTNTLKIYSINEEYGKIGHLADSEDTPSLDIEVTFSAGNKIDLASENNILTIAHEDTTRNDTDNPTDIAANTKVVTGVTTDDTGHVTGITTYEFPEYTTIAPVQSVASGNHITVSTSNNTATVNHDSVGTGSAVTPTSGTAPNWGGDVLTGVSIDSYGHVAGATKGALPSNPVSAASGTTNQIMISDGDNTTSTSGKTITTTAPSSGSDDTTLPTSKAVNDSIDTKINALDSSVSAGSSKVLTGVTEADGKLTAKTDVDYTTIAPVQSVAGDNTWTSVSTSSNTATVSHIGPSTADANKSITEVEKSGDVLTGISIDEKGHVRTKPDTKTITAGTKMSLTADLTKIQLEHQNTTRTNTTGSDRAFGGNVITGVTTDATGHVTGVETSALPSNPVSGLEGTASDTASGITVQVDSTGGEVDNVDVTVALDTLKSALGLTGALIPKGTIGTGGTITTLPTASASNLGWAYKVITAGTYSGISAKVGDVIYCILNDDGETYSWTLIPSGDESFTDTWRNIKVNGVEKLGNGISSGALDVVDGSHSSVSWNGTDKTLQIDVDEASTSQKGVVELTDSYTSTDDTKAATGKSIKAAIDAMDVSSDKGAASISGSTLTIKAVQQADGLIKDGSSTTISLDGTYDASTNKIATESTVSNAIEALDSNATAVDDTSSSLDVINTVSETDGVISSTKKTLAEGTSGKITITAPTSGTNAGKIVIDHANTTPVYEQNTVSTTGYNTPKETDTLVVTGIVTDYGHVARVKVEPSTNLIAADIKAPVTRTDDSSVWNYRETGGPNITIGEDTAKIPVLKGNTIVWNQNTWAVTPWSNIGYVTRSDQGDFYRISKISDGYTFVSLFFNEWNGVTQYYTVPVGHKVYMRLLYRSNDILTWSDGQTNTNIQIPATTDDSWGKASIIENITSQDGDATGFRTMPSSTGVIDVAKRGCLAIDLTKLFGSDFAIEKALLGMTTEVAWNNLTADQLALAKTNFEKLFPNSYYPYCEGRLVNLGGYGVKMNQLIADGASEITGFKTQWYSIYKQTSVNCVVGHKYYYAADVKTDYTNATVKLDLFDSSVTQVPGDTISYTRVSNICSVNTAPFEEYSNQMRFINFIDYGMTLYMKNAVVIDLTLMFGAGNEPTLEECEQIFTEDYYEYNAGYECNILDVANKKLGLESTGFNLWDEEWEEGNIDPYGNPVPSTTTIRSNNFIPVLPLAEYYFYKITPAVNAIQEYDANKNHIRFQVYGEDPAEKNHTFTPTDKTRYIKISVAVTAYQNDICINLSSSRNGEYEPYKKDTLDLDWIRNIGVDNFNIWDEEWEQGQIDGAGGPASGNGIRSGYIPISPNTSYYVKGPSGLYAILLDANKNKISTSKWSGGVAYNDSFRVIPNSVIETSSDAAFIRISTGEDYGNVYKHDICINISNPALNGEYHPYGEKAKYFPQGLLSAGSVYDEVTETKAIKRVGVVDMGDLSWSPASENRFVAAIQNMVVSASDSVNLSCSKFIGKAAFEEDCMWTNNGNVYVVDASYQDESLFKTAMSGILLYYELETPVEIPLATPHPMIYAVADHGTEQQLPVSAYSPFNAPFAGTFEYYSNFKEGVLDLMGRFNDFTPTTEIIPDSNSTLPTSQAVIDYMRAGGNGVKPVYESGDEVIPTTDVHAGLKTEVGNNSYKYYKVPFSAVTNDPSTGTSQVQIILNGNFS